MTNRHHKIVIFDNFYYRFYKVATFLPQKRLRRLFLMYNLSNKRRNVIKMYFLEVSALFRDEARRHSLHSLSFVVIVNKVGCKYLYNCFILLG